MIVEPDYAIGETIKDFCMIGQTLRFSLVGADIRYTGIAYMEFNRVKEIRESLLMSKAELARKSGLSYETLLRIEKKLPCRINTKRKLILALGFKITEKGKIFPED
jgi:DNA-binding XRE family transcriptional regulator